MLLSISSLYAALPLVLYISMAVASVGLLCTLLSVARRVLGKAQPLESNPPIERRVNWRRGGGAIALYAMWIGITAVHVLAWQLYLSGPSWDANRSISYIACLMCVLLSWQLCRPYVASLGDLSKVLMPVSQIAGLCLCGQLASQHDTNAIQRENPPGVLVATRSARTDLGTPINLYAREVDEEALNQFYANNSVRFSLLGRYAMFRSEPSPQMNCHGWIFTGQYIVKSEDVPTILKENGYETVSNPAINDLIVYRDGNGMAVHTGVVCGFLRGTTVLVESKWGVASTYVHLVEEQPYSNEYAFYRSARQGHHLRYGELPSDVVSGSVAGTFSSETENARLSNRIFCTFR